MIKRDESADFRKLLRSSNGFVKAMEADLVYLATLKLESLAGCTRCNSKKTKEFAKFRSYTMFFCIVGYY